MKISFLLAAFIIFTACSDDVVFVTPQYDSTLSIEDSDLPGSYVSPMINSAFYANHGDLGTGATQFLFCCANRSYETNYGTSCIDREPDGDKHSGIYANFCENDSSWILWADSSSENYWNQIFQLSLVIGSNTGNGIVSGNYEYSKKAANELEPFEFGSNLSAISFKNSQTGLFEVITDFDSGRLWVVQSTDLYSSPRYQFELKKNNFTFAGTYIGTPQDLSFLTGKQTISTVEFQSSGFE